MNQAAIGNQDPNGAAAMMKKAFVRQALEGGMAEVQLGNSPSKRAATPM